MKLSNKILILDPNKILKCIAHCNWKNREERPASFHKWVKGQGLGFLTTLAKWNQEVEQRLGEHTMHEHWPLTWCPYLLVKFSSFPKKRFWLMRWITPHPSGQCQPRGTQVFSQDSQSSHLNLEQNSIFPMFWGQNIRRGWMFAFCKMLFYLWIKLLLWLRVFGG